MRRGWEWAAALPLLLVVACEHNPAQPCAADGQCPPSQVAPPSAPRGQVLANLYCAGCHGANYRGGVCTAGEAPSLSVVKSYSPSEFDLLLTTGQASGGGVVDDVMTGTGVSTLAQSDREALYSYLATYVNDQ